MRSLQRASWFELSVLKCNSCKTSKTDIDLDLEDGRQEGARKDSRAVAHVLRWPGTAAHRHRLGLG